MQTKYIFQIGMICAGSTSLCEALNILGIPSLHWQGPDRKIFETEVIQENIKNNRRLFYPYDEEFRGFLDFNGLFFYKTLYEMYPDSKFIYTWRAYDPWLKSTLRLTQNIWREGYNIMIGGSERMKWIVNNTRGQDIPEKEFSLIKTDRQYYWKDNQEIPAFFKNNPRFLQMKICDGDGDGWEKLCGFLEMDIPDVDFPKIPSANLVFSNPVDK
jgi:hypothetical protein